VETVGSTDPNMGLAALSLLLGTGISGGYYPKIKIMVRYGNSRTHLHFRSRGLSSHDSIADHLASTPEGRDLLVRVRSGERFTVNELLKVNGRHHATSSFKATSIPDTDIAYSVKDENIINAPSKRGGRYRKWIGAFIHEELLKAYETF